MQKCPGVVIDAKGAPLGGVSVQVNIASGGTATIFSDNGITSKSNPFTNESNGSFDFYAADGRYDLVFTKAGMTIPSLLDYALSDPVTGDVLILDRDVTAQNVVNTTNATTVYSLSLPGGTLGTARAVRMTALLDILNSTGSDQAMPSIAVHYGGVAAATYTTGATILPTNAARWGVILDFMLCGANATTAQYAWSALRVGSGAGVDGNLRALAGVNHVGVHTGLSVNSATAQTLDLAVANPVANANYATRCLAVHLERV